MNEIAKFKYWLHMKHIDFRLFGTGSENKPIRASLIIKTIRLYGNL